MSIFTHALQQLKDKNRYRELRLSKGVDFSSNDYLGLVSHPVLREAAINALKEGLPLGAGGSRLLRGHRQDHADLEDFAACFFRCDRALFFSSGFLANYALLSTLPDRHDTIVFDSLIHASLRDGIEASFARSIKVPHNDLQAFEDALKHIDKGHAWIVVESVYSMDGDCAPVKDLLALAEKYNAFLVVDEAHATGIFGPGGRGLTEGLAHDRLITVHTCGKALGVAGGLVCGSADVIDMLVNKARPFVYSTAPMPLQALLVRHALELIEKEPERRQRLLALCDYAAKALPVRPSSTQIFPVILGDDQKALDAAAYLQIHGFDIRAIRPPTVPEGTARLRLSLNLGIAEGDVDRLGQVLQGISISCSVENA
ncbi:MAG: 8-amino-7-oxononanoate synthase [Pseudomonadota bacterium]|nr:8-amino-7-oxononanoate synthase [Pseudomonadota bacterium]